ATVGATKIEGMAGTRWVYTASGPVTNVAARLAALGEPDAIMLGPATRSRLGSEFPVEDLGEQPLQNVEQPVRVFRLAAPGPPPRRPAAARWPLWPRPTPQRPARNRPQGSRHSSVVSGSAEKNRFTA